MGVLRGPCWSRYRYGQWDKWIERFYMGLLDGVSWTMDLCLMVLGGLWVDKAIAWFNVFCRKNWFSCYQILWPGFCLHPIKNSLNDVGFLSLNSTAMQNHIGDTNMLVSKNAKICINPNLNSKICVTPNASRWNIGGVGSPTGWVPNARGWCWPCRFHIVCLIFGHKHKRDIQWNTGFRI